MTNLGTENETTEFKESLSELDKGLRSLSAMLNRSGHGTVCFGVNDNGDVNRKVTVGKNTLLEIRNRAKHLIEPQIVLNMSVRTADEGETWIEVSADGFDIPYSCDGRFYIRTAASDESISTNVLRKMLVNNEVDIIRQIPAKEQDLTFQQLAVLLAARKYHVNDTKQFYRSFSLLNEQGAFNLMAYLLADRNDISVKVVRFKGKDKTDMAQRTEYGNRCLLSSVNAVLDYFRTINSMQVDLTEGVRKETPLFDYEAFREAWINACLHTGWQEELPPAVHLFDDRIEIISYGGLTYRLSKEDFYNGVSMPVNKALLFVFMAAGLAEQTGHGVPKIVEACGKEAFSFSENMIKVMIPFRFCLHTPAEFPEIERQTIRLSERQKRVLRFLQANSTATLQDVADYEHISLAGVKKMISGLKKNHLVTREGAKKTGVWIVNTGKING